MTWRGHIHSASSFPYYFLALRCWICRRLTPAEVHTSLRSLRFSPGAAFHFQGLLLEVTPAMPPQAPPGCYRVSQSPDFYDLGSFIQCLSVGISSPAIIPGLRFLEEDHRHRAVPRRCVLSAWLAAPATRRWPRSPELAAWLPPPWGHSGSPLRAVHVRRKVAAHGLCSRRGDVAPGPEGRGPAQGSRAGPAAHPCRPPVRTPPAQSWTGTPRHGRSLLPEELPHCCVSISTFVLTEMPLFCLHFWETVLLGIEARVGSVPRAFWRCPFLCWPLASLEKSALNPIFAVWRFCGGFSLHFQDFFLRLCFHQFPLDVPGCGVLCIFFP